MKVYRREGSGIQIAAENNARLVRDAGQPGISREGAYLHTSFQPVQAKVCVKKKDGPGRCLKRCPDTPALLQI